jgi:hypothetical protein
MSSDISSLSVWAKEYTFSSIYCLSVLCWGSYSSWVWSLIALTKGEPFYWCTPSMASTMYFCLLLVLGIIMLVCYYYIFNSGRSLNTSGINGTHGIWVEWISS